MRILVSGAAGPLGSGVCRALLSSGADVSLSCLDQTPSLVGGGYGLWQPGGEPVPVVAGALQSALDGIDVVVELGVAGTAEEYGSKDPVRSPRAGAGVATGHLARAVAVLAGLTDSPPMRYVLASTGSVYGASARNPALFGEDHTGFRVSATVADRYRDRYSEPSGQGLAELPTAADGVEDLGAHRLGWRGSSAAAVTLERYARGVARRSPDTSIHLLRLAEVVGPGSRTAFAELLRASVVPMVAGFDPRLSLLHESDAAAAIARVALGQAPNPAAGRVRVLNVAGLGAVTLSALIHGLGRLRVFVPGPGLRSLPSELRALLTYGRCLDVTLLGEAGWPPPRSASEVVGALAADRTGTVAGLLRGALADVVGGLAPAGLGALADLARGAGSRIGRGA